MSAGLREALNRLAASWYPTGDPHAAEDANVLWGYVGHLDTESSDMAVRRQSREAARALEPSDDEELDEIADEVADAVRAEFRAQRAEGGVTW